MPLRNCDLYRDYDSAYKAILEYCNTHNCGSCPHGHYANCRISWLLAPYEIGSSRLTLTLPAFIAQVRQTHPEFGPASGIALVKTDARGSWDVVVSADKSKPTYHRSWRAEVLEDVKDLLGLPHAVHVDWPKKYDNYVTLLLLGAPDTQSSSSTKPVEGEEHAGKQT